MLQNKITAETDVNYCTPPVFQVYQSCYRIVLIFEIYPDSAEYYQLQIEHMIELWYQDDPEKWDIVIVLIQNGNSKKLPETR